MFIKPLCSILQLKLEKAKLKQREYTQQVIAAEAPSDKLLQRHQESTRRLEELSRSLEVAKTRQTAANAAVTAGSEASAKLFSISTSSLECHDRPTRRWPGAMSR